MPYFFTLLCSKTHKSIVSTLFQFLSSHYFLNILIRFLPPPFHQNFFQGHQWWSHCLLQLCILNPRVTLPACICHNLSLRLPCCPFYTWLPGYYTLLIQEKSCIMLCASSQNPLLVPPLIPLDVGVLQALILETSGFMLFFLFIEHLGFYILTSAKFTSPVRDRFTMN